MKQFRVLLIAVLVLLSEAPLACARPSCPDESTPDDPLRDESVTALQSMPATMRARTRLRRSPVCRSRTLGSGVTETGTILVPTHMPHDRAVARVAHLAMHLPEPRIHEPEAGEACEDWLGWVRHQELYAHLVEFRVAADRGVSLPFDFVENLRSEEFARSTSPIAVTSLVQALDPPTDLMASYRARCPLRTSP